MFSGFLDEEDQDKLLKLDRGRSVTILPCDRVDITELAVCAEVAIAKRWLHTVIPSYRDVLVDRITISGEVHKRSGAVLLRTLAIQPVQDGYPHVGTFLQEHEGNPSMSVKLRYPYERGHMESIQRLPQGYALYWRKFLGILYSGQKETA